MGLDDLINYGRASGARRSCFSIDYVRVLVGEMRTMCSEEEPLEKWKEMREEWVVDGEHKKRKLVKGKERNNNLRQIGEIRKKLEIYMRQRKK